jgi:hypothetical protein
MSAAKSTVFAVKPFYSVFVAHSITLQHAASCSTIKAASRRLRRWPSASLDGLLPMPPAAAVINALGCRQGSWTENLGIVERIADGSI